MVRKERLELSRREALEPKSSVSTNSTTSAQLDIPERYCKKVVATARFELATPSLWVMCSNQLSYVAFYFLFPLRKWRVLCGYDPRPSTPFLLTFFKCSLCVLKCLIWRQNGGKEINLRAFAMNFFPRYWRLINRLGGLNLPVVKSFSLKSANKSDNVSKLLSQILKEEEKYDE